jgi:hypothetical protein
MWQPVIELFIGVACMYAAITLVLFYLESMSEDS